MAAQSTANGTQRIHANGANGHGTFRMHVDWGQLQATLNLAEEHAAVGTAVPEITRFKGLKRKLARFVARVVVFLAQPVTGKQRMFNVTLLNALRDQLAALRQLESAQAEATRRINGLENLIGQLRLRQTMQEHRTNTLLEEARRRLPAPFAAEQTQQIAGEEAHNLDALYVAFEDQFRGTREDIKDRLKVYVPYLLENSLGTAEMPVLDLGCGRGEWLELLGDEGLHGRGVDMNRALLHQCRQRGLDVVEGDALEYLRGLPDNSVGMVTGFHIIEHLPFDVLIKFFDETVRVLKPGGMVLFETPNPENVLVGSCYFYADLTHRNPLFPPTVQFLAEQRGFVHAEIFRLKDHGWIADPLEPLPEENPLAFRLNPLIETVKRHFFAAADFALIARKAG